MGRDQLALEYAKYVAYHPISWSNKIAPCYSTNALWNLPIKKMAWTLKSLQKFFLRISLVSEYGLLSIYYDVRTFL